MIVGANTAFPKVAAIFAATPLETLKAWQAFHVVDSASPYLSDRFVQARFAFRNKTLGGQPEIQPRWKRGVGFVNGALGEAVGRMYVAQYFTPEAKAKMDALVGNVKAALGARIQRVDWMSPETKAKALEKLSKFTVKIGYPVKWRDYSALTLTDEDLYGDAERGEAFEWERQVKRLDQPVDKLEWDMTPQTVNAYYNPSNNEIVFPAAILQPPFFDPDADPAINYGGIGGVIGHEMTHGFDDQGRKADGDGALHDWWTPEDAAKFDAQADAARRPVRPVRAGAGNPCEGRADHGREHRRPWRGAAGAGRLSRLAARPAGAGDRRPDRRSAGVPGLGPGLAGEGAGRPGQGAGHLRPALAGAFPGQWRDPQCRRLVRRLRRQAGRSAVRRAGPAREDLVGKDDR